MTQLIHWETKIYMTTNAKHEKITLTSLLFGTSIFTGAGNSDIPPGVEDLILVIIIKSYRIEVHSYILYEPFEILIP